MKYFGWYSKTQKNNNEEIYIYKTIDDEIIECTEVIDENKSSFFSDAICVSEVKEFIRKIELNCTKKLTTSNNMENKKTYGWYSQTQERICGFFLSYERPDGTRTTVTQVTNSKDNSSQLEDIMFQGEVTKFVSRTITNQNMRRSQKPTIYNMPVSPIAEEVD